MDVSNPDDRRESVLSDITDPQPRTSRDLIDAEESEEDFSNPLYRTSTDGTEMGTRSLAPGTAGRLRRVVGAEAYDSDDSISSEQGLQFTDIPTHRWNEQIGLQELARVARSYGAANLRRRNGQNSVAVGPASELPMRVAAQQLAALAGMSQKVQEAIVHSQEVFLRQVQLKERALVTRVLHAWRDIKQWSTAAEERLFRVRQRLRRSRLQRCFLSWRDQLWRVNQVTANMKKFRRLVPRGVLQRVFGAWRGLCETRWWKTQLGMRDRQIAQLEAEVRRLECRPVYVLLRRRLKGYFTGWQELCLRQRAKVRLVAVAQRHCQTRLKACSFAVWIFYAEQQREKVERRCKASVHQRRKLLCRLLHAWQQAKQLQTNKRNMLLSVQHHHGCHLQVKALQWWREWVAFKMHCRILGKRWAQHLLKMSLWAWQHFLHQRRLRKIVVPQHRAAQQTRCLQSVLAAWSTVVDDEHVARLIAAKEEQTTKALDLQAALEKARAEIERMFQDNARLVRLIDSGDWGRARVLELVQAGQVLQRERDALAQLVQNMPKGRRTSQAAIVQEPGIKKRSSVAPPIPIAPQPLTKPSAPPKANLHSPSHRNKLLVHGASSYNALVRALKQEILEGHEKVLHDSNALQKINEASLAAVHVEEVSPHAQGVAFGRSKKSLIARVHVACGGGQARDRTGMLHAHWDKSNVV